MPGIAAVTRDAELLTEYGPPARYEVAEWGNRVAILALGGFFALGERVKASLAKRSGTHATLINPRWISDVDADLLEKLKAGHQVVVTLEDGALDGGFGERIARFYGDSAMKVLTYGAKKEFADLVTLHELYDRYHLTAEQAVSDILSVIQ